MKSSEIDRFVCWVFLFFFNKYSKFIITGKGLSSTTIQLMFPFVVHLKCMHMSTRIYSSCFVCNTDDQSVLLAGHHLAIVYSFQLRKINKHPICSHIKQHLSNNKSDNMDNYEVYFSNMLTGKPFGQEKKQGLAINCLGKKSAQS